MVAKMASYEAVCHLEKRKDDVPAAKNKDNLGESDSSSENTGTSTEESANDKDEETEVHAEKNEEDDGNEEEDADEAQDEEFKIDVQFKQFCEKCKDITQSHDYELVTPRRISKGQLQVQLDAEGSYKCSVTGLVFEASERVLVRYSVLSWSKFGAFLPASWKSAGPIFNVDTVDKEASVLKSIEFPHAVCLPDPKNDTNFGVLHVKNNQPLIEPTVNHSGSHVKWNVTSLSPVGPIIQTNQSVEHHGVVMVYKQLGSDNSNSFHIYPATNSSSDINDVSRQVRCYKNRYIRIEKPPTCKLEEGTYSLLCEPEGDIKPQELKFTRDVTKMKGYFEVFIEQPPPYKLCLIKTDTEETVWSATIREGDCVDTTKKKPRKRTGTCKRSRSPSENKTVYKRPRCQNGSDGLKNVVTQGQDMSEKQLLQVARQLGKEWKQVAIYLGLVSKDLDDIQAAEKDVTMQKLKMLVEWKSRQMPGRATAFHLWKSLEDLDELPNEVQHTLQVEGTYL
ncbi:uncharacterized protein LOC103378500 isoform X2 [Cynoglossus semilaevis]|uniref:uncharacterized protein LOC103378500 isoform X2 n=1 Tax=Cynoglossus semilaevis TaxID=244447 RepID=UPI000D622F8B|nr:uncharacterized protein LOC103378500 isoform X2 [Cynoglossus semilaevis]